MLKALKYIAICLLLFGCVASASSLNKRVHKPAAQLIEQNYDEMLELAREMDQERTPAIYIVVISEPEVISAKPSNSKSK